MHETHETPGTVPATLPTLRTVTRTSGANAALKGGSLSPDGFAFEFIEVPVLVQAFRRMVRGLEFDCTEMAITTYLVAKEHGVRMTALPVFLVRDFHHGAIQALAGSGVTDPAQLAGRRVGVNRGYTVTTGVWARSVLAVEHGLDLSSVTWVLSGDEHVESYRSPANVEQAPTGSNLEELLRAGDLAAVVGASISAPDVVPLLPDPMAAAMSAFRSRGAYPINHLVVVRDELLDARPELAAQVFDAFARSKQPYLTALSSNDFVPSDALDRTCARVLSETRGADPLPYGLEPNRSVLAELLDHAIDQRILTRRFALEDLFAAGTHDLVG